MSNPNSEKKDSKVRKINTRILEVLARRSTSKVTRTSNESLEKESLEKESPEKESGTKDHNVIKIYRANTHFFSYYASLIGLFVIPFSVSSFCTSSVLLQAFVMMLGIWLSAEQLFWLNHFVDGHQSSPSVQQSKPRILVALVLLLLSVSFELKEHFWLAISLAIYFYSWLTFVYVHPLQNQFYDVDPNLNKESQRTLISHLAMLTSLYTLLVWRSDQITIPLVFYSLILSQVPLLFNLIRHWQRFICSHHGDELRRLRSFIKHCGPALYLSLATILVAKSLSPLVSYSFVASIAFVLLYYVSYLTWFKKSWIGFQRNLESPLKTLTLSFMALCILGTGLLMLPWVTLNGHTLTFIEAAFTSVSASCITGLSIIDLSQMSFFGQVITLLLIQVGGFGIILLSHLIYSFGRAMSNARLNQGNKQRLVGNLRVKSYLGENHLSATFNASRLAFYVISVELLSGLALSFCFLRAGFPPLESLWHGFFTAISAFCNAGFALQSDSFVSLASSTSMLYIISLTVCLGGFGPTVIFELIDRYKTKNKAPISLFSKIVLWGSGSLFIVPTFFFCWAEWNHAFAHLDVMDKLSNAFFHSTSLRTAGFNTVDLAQLSDASWTLSLLLMLIGGSPLSTAGGIKITTLVIAIMSMLPVLQNRQTIIFSRAVSMTQSIQAFGTLLASLVLAFIIVLVLQITGETLTVKALIFEVFSALGTVGLSMGGTGLLSSFGLSVMMFCMFLGRIGPPVLFLLFIGSKTEHIDKTYLGEEIQLS